MKTLLNNLRSGWNVFRVLRLALGMLVFGMAFMRSDTFLMFLGAWFMLAPLLGYSCCGAAGCDLNQENPGKASWEKSPKNVNFEEIKEKL